LVDLLANAAAGACLLLALRAALTGAGWAWVAAALCAALIAHLFDLVRRWPRRGSRR
jgi:O-antigen/teichoic acid export membrane protein